MSDAAHYVQPRDGPLRWLQRRALEFGALLLILGIAR